MTARYRVSKIILITLAMQQPYPAWQSFFNPSDKSDKKKKNSDTVSPTSAAYSVSSSRTCCLRSPVSKSTEKGLKRETAEEGV